MNSSNVRLVLVNCRSICLKGSDAKKKLTAYKSAGRCWNCSPRLHKDHNLNPRADERYQLEIKIKEHEVELQKVETQLQQKEEELRKATKQELIFEAGQRERKGAYTEALRVWQDIQQLDPNDAQTEQEIRRLTEKQQSADV